ncbi:MAG: hypothetical protein N3D11_00295 [Candidatus Sumerlaeia bacterium]|nr:hypothetical protein [Candidatus Sumerlaeia bacterium]
MAYWLFYVMDFVSESGGFKKQVQWGVAAQQYPTPDWVGAYQNMPLLRKIKCGDWLVAGRSCRFAGYAQSLSDFYQGGRSLDIPCPYDPDYHFEFYERVDVEWYVVPGYEDYENWLDLHDFKKALLKEQQRTGGSRSYSPIDFPMGRCLKQINAGLFKELRRRLDEAGARPIG